jgi:hypothetical protein
VGLEDCQIKADAKAASCAAWATVRRAKDDLGIIAEKAGFECGWVWRLPSDATGDRASESDPSTSDENRSAPVA